MSFFTKLFGSNPTENKVVTYIIPSNKTAKELGKVNIQKVDQELAIDFTILMEPQGKEAEGWQTGVALDASSSMRGAYGTEVKGSIPPEVAKQYTNKGWITVRDKDGRHETVLTKQAVKDAIDKGYLTATTNVVQPLARQFITYLAGELDADGGTTVIYWACGTGDEYEVVGDFTENECKTLELEGPAILSYGAKTMLKPAVHYFVNRFADAKRGMYIFITDGIIDDLEAVKRYTTQLAVEINAGQRNPVKCILVGVGDTIDEQQMEELDNLDTGTDIDIWDHKIAGEMRALIEIFSEVVSENQIVAPVGVLSTQSGTLIKRFTDGLPAKVAFRLPATETGFILEVAGYKIVQAIPEDLLR